MDWKGAYKCGKSQAHILRNEIQNHHSLLALHDGDLQHTLLEHEKSN